MRNKIVLLFVVTCFLWMQGLVDANEKKDEIRELLRIIEKIQNSQIDAKRSESDYSPSSDSSDESSDDSDNEGHPSNGPTLWDDNNFDTNVNCAKTETRPPTLDETTEDKFPVPAQCGQKSVPTSRILLNLLRRTYNGEINLDERIVGGEISDKGEWPWQIAIGHKSTGQFCGATLISDQWAVTAAHCVEDKEKLCDWNLRLGEHDLTSSAEKHIDVGVEKIIKHPNYDHESVQHDITLLKLKTPVAASQHEYINHACLPDPVDKFKPGTKCFVSGWGDTSFNGSSSAVVKHVGVELLEDSDCLKAYGTDFMMGMLCAGAIEGGKDACQGDSGGPLVCQDKNGKYDLVGVVSWGKGCALKGYPGVYARVTDYLNWIEATIANN